MPLIWQVAHRYIERKMLNKIQKQAAALTNWTDAPFQLQYCTTGSQLTLHPLMFLGPLIDITLKMCLTGSPVS